MSGKAKSKGKVKSKKAAKVVSPEERAAQEAKRQARLAEIDQREQYVNEMANKMKRQEAARELKSEKAKLKREDRDDRKRKRAAGEEDPATVKKQKTIENMREKDETMVLPDDEEVAADEATDEFASCFSADVRPKLLITTSRKPVGTTFEFIQELLNIFQWSEFHERNAFDLKDIVGFAKERGFTDLLVINEDHKKPNAIILSHLPDGPTAHFKLSSVVIAKKIKNHARSSLHRPELVLNNFNTRLGHTVGRMLGALLPHDPEFKGRRVATFHNQRDFIFFRQHRYIFRNEKKVGLQEMGPRFTLKLQSLQLGTFDSKYGEYEWTHNRKAMDTSKRRFFL